MNKRVFNKGLMRRKAKDKQKTEGCSGKQFSENPVKVKFPILLISKFEDKNLNL